MKQLSIIILQYNNCKLTLDLLKSIYQFEHDAINWELIVIDNNSTEDDGFMIIQTIYPEVSLIKNDTNIGFASAINKVSKNIMSEFILLLNNDMLLLNNAISQTLDLTIKCNSHVSSCKVIGPKNEIQNTSTVKLSTLNIFLSLFGFIRLFNFYKNKSKKPISVGYINGAFLLIKNSTFKSVNYFNSQFFMYGEDIDLMLRLNKLKIRMLYVPDGIVKHFDGASAKKVWTNKNKYLLKMSNSLIAHKLNKNQIDFMILKIILMFKEIFKYLLLNKKLYIYSALKIINI